MAKRANQLFIEKEGQDYVIRMTPELQEDIGTVGFVEFSEEDQVEKEGLLANLEASKTVLELPSPLAGKIAERHEAVVSQPELLNSVKPEENWIVKLTQVDEAAYEALENA